MFWNSVASVRAAFLARLKEATCKGFYWGMSKILKGNMSKGIGSNIKSNRKKSDPSVYDEFLFHPQKRLVHH